MNTKKPFFSLVSALLIFCMGGGIILNSCQPETITAEGTDLLTTVPEFLHLASDGDKESITVTSKFPWTWSLTYPDGQSARPFNVELISENELQVSAPERVHDGGVNFDDYTAMLEIHAVEHPEIRKELSLVQYSEAPVLDLKPTSPEGSEDYDAIWEGIENGFDVPQSEITEYRMTVISNFPVEVTEDCEWLETSFEDGILTVTANPSYDTAQGTAEVVIGNTIYMDGEEEDARQAISFRLGELVPEIRLGSLDGLTALHAYNKGSASVYISSNCEWTVSSDADWIKFNDSPWNENVLSEFRGNPDITTIYCHFDVNFNDERSGYIYVTSSDNSVSHKIQVTQLSFEGIEYTTTDGQKLTIPTNIYSGHRFENGRGKIALYRPNEGEVYRGAFNNCSTLKTITLQSALETVGSAAFSGCTSLEEVIFRNHSFNNGNGIESSAFYNCVSLKELNVPGGALNGHSIGHSTFENCTSLTRVHWGDDLVEIGERAFCGCRKLSELTDKDGEFPGIGVGDYAFYGCEGLTAFGLLREVGKYAFYKCLSLSDVQFDHDWEWRWNYPIGDYAFYQCTGLKEIHLPETLREIGQYAFSNSGLNHIQGKDIHKVGTCAFFNCSYLKTIELGDELEFIGIKAFSDCRSLEKVRLGMTYMMQSKFEREIFGGCKALKSLYMNFYTPPTLTSTIFGDGDMYIGNNDPLNNPEFRIYVPEDALADYRKAEFWKDYPLEGIPSEEFYKPLE